MRIMGLAAGVAAVLASAAFLFPAAVPAAEYGVYVKVAEKVPGTFDETVKKLEDALEGKGWQVVKSYTATPPEGCGFKAHTIVLHNASYARKMLAHGPMAAFILPPRVEVYEDETGIHVAYLNPLSLSRTVLGEGVADKAAAAAGTELADILTAAAGGTRMSRQIGQLRSKGRVGGMGGGDFADKVEVLHERKAAGTSLAAVADKVKEGVRANTAGWELSYTLDCIAQGAVILGVNKKATEARAYGIAGDKRESKVNPCPGLDHAAAFPIEVVVYQEGDIVRIAILDEMYRMKVYFEDAGKWAFMKNMTMPGEIEDEIVEMVKSRLGE